MLGAAARNARYLNYKTMPPAIMKFALFMRQKTFLYGGRHSVVIKVAYVACVSFPQLLLTYRGNDRHF